MDGAGGAGEQRALSVRGALLSATRAGIIPTLAWRAQSLVHTNSQAASLATSRPLGVVTATAWASQRRLLQ